MRPSKPRRTRWQPLIAVFSLALVCGIVILRPGPESAQPIARPSSRELQQRSTSTCIGLRCRFEQSGAGDQPLPAARTGRGSGTAAGGSSISASTAAAARAIVLGTADGASFEQPSQPTELLPRAEDLPPLFLFIGILSGRGYRHRRLAVREAWSSRAQVQGLVVSKFILSEDERTPQVQKEMETYNDIVFVKEKTNYKSILFKTFFVMEYAVRHWNAKFVLKTDDDAFINVPPLIDQLRALCETPECAGPERLYLGKMARHSEVLLTPGHKWNNAIFHNHTGLKVYPNYMMGGGYVVSGEVCRMLVDVHARMRLKFTPIEDATLGFWLMAMDLRHVDHRRFYTWAAPCCFKAPVRRQGQRLIARFVLADEFEEDLCSDDPWLVLHKIDSPTKMRYVGKRVANCSSGTAAALDPSLRGLAPSIEAYLPPAKQQLLAAARAEGKLPPPRHKAGSKADAAHAAAEAAETAARKSGQQAEVQPQSTQQQAQQQVQQQAEQQTQQQTQQHGGLKERGDKAAGDHHQQQQQQQSQQVQQQQGTVASRTGQQQAATATASQVALQVAGQSVATA